jgi:signal transduction histidine kinase/CheY-like chemotaxis protein
VARFLAQNLSVRILLLSLSLATVLVMAVMLMVSQVFINESKRTLISEKQLKTSQIAQLINDNLRIRRDALTEFTLLLQSDNALKSLTEIQQVLDQRVFLHRYFNGGLMVLDANAIAIVDSPILPDRVGTGYDDRDHVQWVKQHLETYISHPFIGRRLHTPIITMNAPILNQAGELLGYMVGISLLQDDFMMQDLAQRFARTHESVYLIDLKNQMFVSSTDSTYVFKPFDQLSYPDVIQQLSQLSTEGQSVGFNGEPVLYVSEALSLIDWQVLAMNPMDKVMAPIYALLQKMMFLVLLILLIALPFVYLLMKKQLKPLGEACRQIDQTLQQTFPLAPLNVTTDDEIANVIRGFNQLIAHQNQQHEVLEQARQQAEQASALKSRFLATVGHEVRTPMVGILGLTDLALMANNDPEKQQSYLMKLQTSGQSLLALLNNILDFSKIEAHQVTINNHPFELKALVNQLTSQFESSVEQKGIKLRIDLDTRLLSIYCGDSARLLQVLTNLVGNAIKFTHQGFVRVSVSPLARQSDNQAWLLFEVLDSGIGMTDAQQSRLFQAFSQADDVIARDYGGTGLGLVISQDLVLLMGGEAIEVSSRLAKGSRFSFVLPFDLCSYQQLDHFLAQDAQTLLQPMSLDDVRLIGRVLVAEDNPINQHVIGELLLKLGLDVMFVEDGEAAVEAMQAESFDLVLMDRHMPKLNGYLATEKIRQFDVFTPIVALTASNTDKDLALIEQYGMNGLIQKPIDFLHTATTVAKWLNQPICLSAAQPVALEVRYKLADIVDVQKGVALMNGRYSFYAKMLGAFAASVEADFFAIKRRFEILNIKREQDPAEWDTLFRACHSLTGICKGLALVKMVEELAELEQAIKQRHLPNQKAWTRWQQTIVDSRLTIQQSIEMLLDQEGKDIKVK